MSTVQEIKTAIESLTPEERAELERLLHSPAVNSVPVRLPNYAERRRHILGGKVLPNLVIEAREER